MYPASKITAAVLIFTGSLGLAEGRWVAPSKETLGVRLGLVQPVLFSEIKDTKPTGAGTTIKYQPSVGTKTAVTLFYSQFALTGSIANKVNDIDATSKGSSRAEDYQFRFYYKYGTWDFFYQNYQGYYINNSQDIDSSYSGSLKIQRPDIKMSHTGVQYFYILNSDNYSLGGTFDQNIRQTISGGSAFLSGYLGSHSIHADGALIPSQVASGYGSFANFKDGDFQNIRAGGGYGYTAVLNKFYAGFIFGFSLGLQQQRFDLISEKFDRWVSSNGQNLRLALGYNGERFFSGVQYIVDNTTFNFNEYQMGLTTGEFKIFIGTRFEGIKIPIITSLGDWLYGE